MTPMKRRSIASRAVCLFLTVLLVISLAVPICASNKPSSFRDIFSRLRILPDGSLKLDKKSSFTQNAVLLLVLYEKDAGRFTDILTSSFSGTDQYVSIADFPLSAEESSHYEKYFYLVSADGGFSPLCSKYYWNGTKFDSELPPQDL